jgi:hypothetical protein
MPSKLNIVVKIPPSQFPDGSYMTIIPDPLDPSLAPLFANSIGYVSGVSTIENVNVDAGSYLNGYAIDNLATHLNGAVITGTTVALPDTNAPTFSLSPNQTSYTITEGDAFFAPTLTLTDDVDGSSTPSPTSSNVDTSTAGNYEITWSGLSDSAGNVIEDVTVSVVVEVIESISRVFIDTVPLTNAHYTLDVPSEFVGDFIIQFDFTIDPNEPSNTHRNLTGAASESRYEILFLPGNGFTAFDGATNTRIVTIDGNPYIDNALHTCRVTRVGPTQSLFMDGVFMGSNDMAILPVFVDTFANKGTTGNRFKGKIANIELTDVDTQANSVEFAINEPNDNSEISNGVTLTYNNVAQGSVRGLYNLNADGTQWVSPDGTQTIDIAAQA